MLTRPWVTGTLSAVATFAAQTNWIPSNETGLYLWFKAESLTLNNNDPINSWSDSSGNGRDIVLRQGGSIVYRVNIFGARPSAFCSTTDLGQSLQTATTLSAPSPYTVGLVAQPASIPSTGNNYLNGFNNGTSSWGRSIVLDHTTVWQGFDYNNDATFEFSAGGNGDLPVVGQVASLILDDTAGGTMHLWVNNNTVPATATAGNPLLGSLNQFCLFNNTTSTLAAPFNGYIPEVVVYDHVLTATTRNNLNLYFKRYGTP